MRAFNSEGNSIICRSLLDCGSQSNFISHDLAISLNCKIESINSLKIIGIGTCTTKFRTTIKVQSLHSNFSLYIHCTVLPNLPLFIPDESFPKFNIPSSKVALSLADPIYFQKGQVHLIFGTAIFWSLLKFQKYSLGPKLPVLYNTKLGWILTAANDVSIAACSKNYPKPEHKSPEVSLFQTSSMPLDNINPSVSGTLHEAEILFLSSLKVDIDGRYMVKLPLKDSPNTLGDSYGSALRRLFSLEKKLTSYPHIRKQYNEFMQEYLDLGHMSPLNSDPNKNLPSYYIPHHCVFNENSLTTKCRVVFDASAPSSNGVSLNSILHVGPKIQPDIFDLLIKFRRFDVAITADVTKMYRQVKIDPEHRRLQRILWRFSEDEPVKIYELNTVTYGTASASFQAERSLQQGAYEKLDALPEPAKTIIKEFYVDDFVSNKRTVEHAKKSIEGVNFILRPRGFELRKWVSNKPAIFTALSQDPSQKFMILSYEDDHQVLGVTWNPKSDEFILICNIQPPKDLSKRSVLASINSIFDPLGLLEPIVNRAKLFLQELWSLKLHWDDNLSIEQASVWNDIVAELQLANNLRVPRQVIASSSKIISVHGFCDASPRAYGASIYISSQLLTGQFQSYLLCAKSRLASKKSITLPKLELCSAVLLAQLMYRILGILEVKIHCVLLWSDSNIALSWIKNEKHTTELSKDGFISRRVELIRKFLNNENWRYIPSSENPADLLTRGITAKKLEKSKLWWYGPPCIRDYTVISSASSDIFAESQPSNTLCLSAVQSEPMFLFSRYSNFSKLLRITSYCLRFIENLKLRILKKEKILGPLTCEELKNSKMRLCKIAQKERFSVEYNLLKRNVDLPKNNSFVSLSPFVENGLIRVGGRLKNAPINYDAKHQILLPKNHPLTSLIIASEHVKSLHCGPQMLLSLVRGTFWPIHGLKIAKKIVNSCVPCKRVRPTHMSQLMGNLPSDRVTPSRPFTIIGIDHCGPFKVRLQPTWKTFNLMYIVVFICFSTKAIHLEITFDLTTYSLLLALQRFVSRRGAPRKIYSDQSKTFIGAKIIYVGDYLFKLIFHLK